MGRISICASGLVTSGGLNGRASLAAIRAGIRSVKETNLWDPESGTYLAAGKVPLPQWWVGLGKLADLAAPAIFECLKAAEPEPPERIPIFLGIAPPDRPFRLPGLDDQLLEEIQDRLEFRFHPASGTIAQDRVSVASALAAAEELILTGRARQVIVAAVDSLLKHDLKNYYLERRRLLTPGHSNGFSLGEAGSALLVRAAGNCLEGELQLEGIAAGCENATIESEEPLRGDGLTQVIRQTLLQAACRMQDVSYRLADLNGEHYRFKEFILAMGRFPRQAAAEKFDVWHPIEYVGDVGAAIGPLLLAVALDAGRKRYAPGRNVLCTLGNDGGERAALLLSYRKGGENAYE